MSRLRVLAHQLRESFWFLPGLIVFSAAGLAFALIETDDAVGQHLWEDLSLFFGAKAAGARAMLSSIATSMITVAGVVFSITLVALSMASSQYSSRVLRNFMKDRPNQIVLGTFLGIFVYCLIVMRTIRDGDENAFVPSIAVTVAILLAFVGIALLIYFIHHISTAIQASDILARIAAETTASVDRLFPEELGEELPAPPNADPGARRSDQSWFPVLSRHTGYITTINSSDLLAYASERKTIVRMERGIGEFVIEGTLLASVLAQRTPDAEDADSLRDVFNVGTVRTTVQDAGFGIRQIVDVAVKALSPGINDTTTAIMALDYLTAILFRLANRTIESPYRLDDGQLRVISRGPSFESLVCKSFDQVRQNAAGNPRVLLRLVEALETLSACTRNPKRRAALLRQARALAELITRSIHSPLDREPIEARAAELLTQLQQTRPPGGVRSAEPPAARRAEDAGRG